MTRFSLLLLLFATVLCLTAGSVLSQQQQERSGIAAEAYHLYQETLKQLLRQTVQEDYGVKPLFIRLLTSPLPKKELEGFLNAKEKVCDRQMKLVEDPKTYVDLRRNPCSLNLGAPQLSGKLKKFKLMAESLLSENGEEYHREQYQIGQETPVEVNVSDQNDANISKLKADCQQRRWMWGREWQWEVQRCEAEAALKVKSALQGALSNRKFNMNFDLNQIQEIPLYYNNIKRKLKGDLGIIPKLAFIARKPKMTIRVTQADFQNLQQDILKKKFFQIGSLRFDELNLVKEDDDEDAIEFAAPDWAKNLAIQLQQRIRMMHPRERQWQYQNIAKSCPKTCLNLPQEGAEGMHRVKVASCLCLCENLAPPTPHYHYYGYGHTQPALTQATFDKCKVSKSRPVLIEMRSSYDQVLGYAES